jgi:hypothetical protein
MPMRSQRLRCVLRSGSFYRIGLGGNTNTGVVAPTSPRIIRPRGRWSWLRRALSSPSVPSVPYVLTMNFCYLPCIWQPSQTTRSSAITLTSRCTTLPAVIYARVLRAPRSLDGCTRTVAANALGAPSRGHHLDLV